MIVYPKKTSFDIEKSITKTYRKDLLKPFVRAIDEFELIKENDKIAIAISGGKDSLLMAKLFQELKRHNKYPFELEFIMMNPGFNDINLEQAKANASSMDIPLKIFNSDVFYVVNKISQEQPCYLCARMRRGFLYKTAKDLGCNKLALGHHFDDVIETTMLNILYGSQFKTMVPKIKADNFEDIELIRPMIFIKESDIIRFANSAGIKTMDCGCAVAAKEISSKRLEIKELIKELKKKNKDVDYSIFNSAINVNLDCLLGYQKNDVKYHFNDIYKSRNKEK